MLGEILLVFQVLHQVALLLTAPALPGLLNALLFLEGDSQVFLHLVLLALVLVILDNLTVEASKVLVVLVDHCGGALLQLGPLIVHLNLFDLELDL